MKNTVIFHIENSAHPTEKDAAIIEEAAAYIRNGGLVAFPTETVYGLGADARDSEAASRVYAAKGRPSDNPLIVHIARMETLAEAADEISEDARRLAERFWPGPLTMIFPKKQIIPDATTGGLQTVAVRMPADPVALRLIEAAGGMVAAPSANLSGRPSPTAPEHVIEDLSGRIDAILAAGTSDIGIESTIVDMSVEVPEVLRPGFVTPDMIANVIPRVQIDASMLPDSSQLHPKAPGMKYRHYAPKAQLTIVTGESGAVADYINRETAKAQKERVGVLASAENAHRYENALVKVLGGRSHPADIAKHLYAALREFDAEEIGSIYSESFDGEGMGFALMNRLLKAAGHKVVEV